MAWFHFCTANHNEKGRSTLVDMADWFEAGLLDLGHKVTFSDSTVEEGAINLFWENFAPGMGEAIAKTSVTYGIIATEIPDGHAFNWRTEPYWKERFDAFSEAAKGASFVWTMVESTVPFYSQFCPTAFMELGYSDRLIPKYQNDDPQIDFCFFGLRTPYREEIVRKLERYARVEWPKSLLTAEGVAKLVGDSKIGLNFKQSGQWPIPSPTRLGRLLMAKRAVASEFVPVATRQGEITGLCPEGAPFHEYALEILNSDWRARAKRAFEVYKETMPMKLIMENILDHTVSSLPPERHSGQVPIAALLPPMVVDAAGIWKFVRWGEGYFAQARWLRGVDVTMGIEALQKTYGKDKILHSGDMAELRERARAIEKKKPLVAFAIRMAERQYGLARKLKSLAGVSR
jgi:hypothetical protein